MFTFKKLFFLCALLFPYSYGSASVVWQSEDNEDVSIPLRRKRAKEDYRTQKRAPRQIPCVIYNGVELRFLSSSSFQAQYYIISEGNVVEYDVLELFPNVERVISVAGLESGDYELQLTIGSDVYVGNFTIEE